MSKQSPQEELQAQLKQANQRLKAANTGLSLCIKGLSLYARGTLPPKPGSLKTIPYQQEIALKIRANPAGLKRAEAEAKKIGAALALKEFDWSPYLSQVTTPSEQRTIAEWIVALEVDYFQRRQRNPKSESTWRAHYFEYLRRLPQKQPLTVEILEQAIRRTPPDSCTRAATYATCCNLGKFAGLDVAFLKPLRGKYSSMRPAPRNLPSDEDIVEVLKQISNPAWRWVAAMIATYGLRPHEAFLLDTTDLENGGVWIRVLDGKTGPRTIPPLHPEWVQEFNLREKRLPKVRARNHSQAGVRVSGYFKRHNLPFKPYDLRHCWAVRSLRYEIHVSLAARRMGHSVDVHTKIYQAWIADEIDQSSYEQAINRPDRPSSPHRQLVQVEPEASTVNTPIEMTQPNDAITSLPSAIMPTSETEKEVPMAA